MEIVNWLKQKKIHYGLDESLPMIGFENGFEYDNETIKVDCRQNE